VSSDHAVGAGGGRRCGVGIVAAQCGFGGYKAIAACSLRWLKTRTAAIAELTKAALAAAKARGRRLATPDPAGAVERMRVARKAQAMQFAMFCRSFGTYRRPAIRASTPLPGNSTRGRLPLLTVSSGGLCRFG
jgi:hypothetical protein